MTYTVECDDRAGLVIVRVVGELTVEAAAEYTQAAQAAGGERGITRYLIDVRQARNVESTLANYQFAYTTLPEIRAARSNRVAVLHAPHDHSHDFVETVSRNAGYNVRMFDDLEEALGWLHTAASASMIERPALALPCTARTS